MDAIWNMTALLFAILASTAGLAALLSLVARSASNIWRRRTHRSHPSCLRCGYDLQGHVGAGHVGDTCPECGTRLASDNVVPADQPHPLHVRNAIRSSTTAVCGTASVAFAVLALSQMLGGGFDRSSAAYLAVGIVLGIMAIVSRRSQRPTPVPHRDRTAGPL